MRLGPRERNDIIFLLLGIPVVSGSCAPPDGSRNGALRCSPIFVPLIRRSIRHRSGFRSIPVRP
ncbi:putative lipoprotein [Burkholderia pseudomallei 668]|nr:putative lipoprotein [Burkholderia pseudomallei 668]